MDHHRDQSFSFRVFLALFVLFFLFPLSYSQSCHNYVFSGKRDFASCTDLPVLDSYLHWTYHSATGALDIAYRRRSLASGRWVAWAINPNSKGMLGAQALVAFQASNGVMRTYTSPITSYKTQLQPGNLSFEVPHISAEFVNNEMTIFATLQLPYNITTINQLWQDGPLNADVPGMHEVSLPHVQSSGSLNISSGLGIETTGGGDSSMDSKMRRRYVHGILNAVSWGIMMPIGALMARYLKAFKSTGALWFYLHIATQSSAYFIGIAGWVTGLILGKQSPGIEHNLHRNIGIALFCLGTLQAFAMGLRPKPNHKYRIYWNIYHHTTGYLVIIFSILNVFKGIDILQPAQKWKTTYTAIVIGLGAIAVVLEVVTWFIFVLQKKRAAKVDSQMDNVTVTSGVSGGNAIPEDVV